MLPLFLLASALAPTAHANLLLDENFSSPASLTAPNLTLVGDTVSDLTWASGVADGIAGPASGGVIYSYPRDSATQSSSYAYMQYKIQAPAGTRIDNPTASITIHNIGGGTQVTLASSTNGTTWQNQVAASPATYYGDYSATATPTVDTTGQNAYQDLSTVYFRIGMPTFLVNTTNPLAVLDSLSVQADIPQQTVASLDPGHQILLQRGLQIEAVVGSVSAGLSRSRWIQSNFTTPLLVGGMHSTNSPVPLGGTWGRWASAGNTNPIYPDETTTIGQLLNLQFSDEQNIADPTQLQLVTDTFNTWRQQYPDTLIYTNQYGSENTPADLRTYLRTARPNMLMFDSYAFNGNLPGNSPTTWYRDLQKYRTLALGGLDGTGRKPIPFGQWLQTFATPLVNNHVVSESELRLNQFAGWAFGATFASAFIYDSSAAFGSVQSDLFTDTGDATPTATFAQIAHANRQSRNLGPALVRLLSTDVRFIPGQHQVTISGQTVAVANTLPTGLAAWNANADPYITSITATNPGQVNHHLPGDMIVGYFTPLLESFDSNAFSRQIYFMIVNALTGPSASAADASQLIRVNFDFGSSGITRLLRLDRQTGQIETVLLLHDSGSLYHLDLLLPGGTGDLFKFDTGAPFVVPEPTGLPMILLLLVALAAIRPPRRLAYRARVSTANALS